MLPHGKKPTHWIIRHPITALPAFYSRQMASTAGKRLVRLLNKSLASGAEWTEGEQATMAVIEATADGVDVLKALFDAEVGKPVPARHRVCELAGEIRQSEAAITKMIASLDPAWSA